MCKNKIILIIAIVSLGLLNSCTSRNIYTDYNTESGSRQVASVVNEESPVITAAAAPTSGTCYLRIIGDVPEGVKTQWAYGTHAAWTGADAAGDEFSSANCDTVYPSYTCTSANLSSGVSYYFAVRLIDGTDIGKWSNIVVCKTP
ncbi:hypothetical protein K2P97_02910 [bacterium]|nr:hypothetical protein [bacterium]